MKLIRYHHPRGIVDYLLRWLIIFGEILDCLVGILSLGLCTGSFTIAFLYYSRKL